MNLILSIDQFLREPWRFTEETHAGKTARSNVSAQVRMIVMCGLVYGAVMGSFNGFTGEGWKQMFVSGSKVPFLFLVTFLLCLPSFYVLNTVAGLHGDFGKVLNAVLGFQSLASIVLAALAPVTGLMNASTGNYAFVVFWNGIMFAVASVAGLWMMSRLYRPLVAMNHRHGLMLKAWIVLYWFVGIQMAWVLRPFIGDPQRPVQFFRPEAWGNAYVNLIKLIVQVLHC